ncbi:hypothetical protein [Ostreibacterium oceani]|uniref:Transposase IS4-like domain-containing protein n=1 Tax=Ostreibacterium oceani TaxID=2654998 RepID=A0A6N7F0E2_9GAMM|nr:hypothetical protein [Ostreibacterium oceani]MPV85316.1 hypothetical protein [Ostreibacterium oceani]
MLGDEVALYADAAYASNETRETLARLGIDDQANRSKPLSSADLLRNKRIALTASTAKQNALSALL